MKKTAFPTPQDAEAAYYEALESCDLEAMMEVWAEDEEIVCVHPGGPRLSGYAQVRESWSRIFKSGQRLKIQTANHVMMQGMMLSVHCLHENITVAGEAGVRHAVVATNAYFRTASGWRMILHHASPSPQPVRVELDAGAKTLH